ncbi:hypothetical protein T484DRAFT_1817242, partial [Baffinella frigidus]
DEISVQDLQQRFIRVEIPPLKQERVLLGITLADENLHGVPPLQQESVLLGIALADENLHGVPPLLQERVLLGIALADENLHGVISLPLLLDGLTRVGAPQPRDLKTSRVGTAEWGTPGGAWGTGAGVASPLFPTLSQSSIG